MEQRRLSDVEIEEQDRAVREDGRHDGVTHLELLKEVRRTDIEPYTGLRYLSKLFRFMAIILLLLLIAEIVMGIYSQGAASVPTLLGEASRLIVLAGVLWGTGDLAHLLIDVGHDVRASRILLARQVHNTLGDRAPRVPTAVQDEEHISAPPPIP